MVSTLPKFYKVENLSSTLLGFQHSFNFFHVFFQCVHYNSSDRTVTLIATIWSNFRAPDRQKSNYQKVKCLINYFNRLLAQDDEDFNDLQGVISFHRRCLDEDERPKWESLDLPLTSCLVKADGLIENMDGTLQVDFANKFVLLIIY